MEIKEFIEKAIAGRYNESIEDIEKEIDLNVWTQDEISAIFLDPKAWQAVGKIEGWDEESFYRTAPDIEVYGSEAKFKMHGMIDALCDGKSIEDYIKTL